MNNPMVNPTKAAKGRNKIKRGPGKRIVDGKSFRLADEVSYIQRRRVIQGVCNAATSRKSRPFISILPRGLSTAD